MVETDVFNSNKAFAVYPTIETGRGRWFFCTPGSRPFGMVYWRFLLPEGEVETPRAEVVDVAKLRG